MHEFGIAQEMLRVALDYATKNHAQRITQFNIEISAAADESEDSLRFHIENLAQGTPAEGAHIEITRVPAQVKCLDCGNEFELSAQDVVCPRCAGRRVRAHAHDEFKLVSIDAE